MVIQTRHEFDTLTKLCVDNPEYQTDFLIKALIEWWECSGKTVVHAGESVEKLTQIVHDDFDLSVSSDVTWDKHLLRRLDNHVSIADNHFIQCDDTALKTALAGFVE